MSEISKVVVVGSGAFGTALAAVIAQTGKVQVTLMARTALLANELAETHQHKSALPGVMLPETLHYTLDAACLNDADVVLFAMPSQSQREAARRYAADPVASGCLVVEGTHSHDAEARAAACVFQAAAEKVIHAYIAERHPGDAERLTDFVSTTMTGLSANARRGDGLDRLLATAHVASLALAQAI